ncbi:adipose-secreted signaling protein-like [Tubulanus polymorphus]|uniref:adipose-secreted signaling protein-like n=1 Tax=Tubulanus polymorphus TaxID=672921 RepID=UPI003DA2E39B
MQCTAGLDSKVHFPVEQTNYHNAEIIIINESDCQISVNLGFLQINHFYDIQFTIVDDLGEDVTFDELGNIQIKMKDVRPSEDGLGHDLTIQLLAHKEKLMNETFTLTSASNPEKTVKVVLHARVLGKGKGTPSLKSGIHCTGINADDDSEASDWQGFE